MSNEFRFHTWQHMANPGLFVGSSHTSLFFSVVLHHLASRRMGQYRPIPSQNGVSASSVFSKSDKICLGTTNLTYQYNIMENSWNIQIVQISNPQTGERACQSLLTSKTLQIIICEGIGKLESCCDSPGSEDLQDQKYLKIELDC